MRSPVTPLLLALALILGFLPALPAETAPSSSAKWEKNIAAYEASDRAEPPESGGIVFIGSSSIRMWKTLADDFPKHHVLNRGFGGSQMIDSVHFADRIVVPYKPRMVVVYAGGNDLNAGKAPEQILRDFQAFVEKVRSRSLKTTIAYISIAGNPKRWAQVEQVKMTNRLIENYVERTPGLKYIDVFTRMLGEDGLPLPDIFLLDRLHMNAKGYQLWTEIVSRVLPGADR